MSNEYKPTYVDNTDNSISIMERLIQLVFVNLEQK